MTRGGEKIQKTRMMICDENNGSVIATHEK